MTTHAAVTVDGQYHSEARLTVVESLSMASQSIDGQLAARLAVLDGVAAFAATEENLTGEKFEQFAASLDLGGVRSLQLAPGAVVTHVHPLEGNEEAVGHDLLADPDRRADVEATYAAGDTVMTGPLDLVQGGKGFIARKPVPGPSDSHPWGLAVIVFDAEAILGPLDPASSKTTTMALVGTGPAGQRVVLHGDSAVLDQNPMFSTDLLPAGSWQIAAVPSEGWNQRGPITPWIWAGGSVLAVVASTGTAWLIHQPRRMRSKVAQATSQIQARTSQLETLVANLSTGVLVETEDRTVLRVNRTFLSIFNLRDEPRNMEGADCQMAARGAAALFVDGEAWLESVEDRIKDARVVRGEAFETVDGRVLERDYLPALLDGKTRGHIWQYRDITEHRDAQRRLEELNEHLQELDAMKTRLLNTVSHQLKTPLTPLVLQLEILRDDAATLGPEHRTALEMVDRNVTRLQALVMDLLDVSHIQSGRLRVDPTPVDLDRICEDVLQAHQPVFDARGVTAAARIPDGCRPTADAERLRQVLENLVSNAAKWTPPDGRIWVSAEDREGTVEIRIRDEGPGLEPEQMRGLFLPFSQVHEMGRDAPGGTGLGLYICKGFVEAQGGKIWAESDGKGEGATFCFTLPGSATDQR